MRKFKINGVSYEVVNNGNVVGDKYDILWFNEKQNGWNRLASANTLKRAYDIAYERNERDREIERENEKQQEEFNSRMKELSEKDYYCSECGCKISFERAVYDGFDYCDKCLNSEY